MTRSSPITQDWVGDLRHPRPARRRGFQALGTLLALGAAAAMSGCVVAPVPYREAPPPRAVYVEPAYPSPGPGWVWMAHPGYGWGWHHPHRGWHRGWRD